MVVRRHEEVFDIIILNGLHSLDSLATAVLGLKIVHRHALDIAKLRHGNDRILVRNHILDGNVEFVISNLTSSVIPIFDSDDLNLFLDDAKQELFIRKNRL